MKRSKRSNVKSEFTAVRDCGRKQGKARVYPRRQACRVPAAQLDSHNRFNRPSRTKHSPNQNDFISASVTRLPIFAMRNGEWEWSWKFMTSSVPGGTCLARIRFQDGQLRCFNNDLDNESCCYYFGVRRYWNPSHGVNAVRSKFFLRG